MSKITNPNTEGSVSCGFYNSLGDRKYDAAQMSSLFDGLINDGVFASIGTALVVKAASGNTVTVGVGKAWFNHTWTYNDALLPITCDDSEILVDRIDAIVIEVNSEMSVRDNFIKYVKGTPSSNPVKPIMVDSELVHQHALCYIRRSAGSSAITQADIENVVGTLETPFVTGIVQTISLDELLGQWRSQLDQFVQNKSENIDAWCAQQEADLEAWFNDMKTDMEAEQALHDQWIASEQADFLAWYNEMKGQLSQDSAGNLQLQIDKEEVDRILATGFPGNNTTISADGKTINISDASGSGMTITKTFSDDFGSLSIVLKSAAGAVIARVTKEFTTGSDGSAVTNTTVSYT